MKISIHDFIEHLKQEIELFELDKMQSKVENVKRQLDILLSLKNTGLLTDEVLIPTPEEANKTEEESATYPINTYVFKKLLSGGTAIGVTGSFISETIVRNLNLESGDLIKYNVNGHKIDVGIVEKHAEKVEEDFIVYKYCEVKKDDVLLYCDESFYGGKSLIRLNEVPYKYVLPTNIIDRFKIEEGDFVDIGYEKGNIYNFKLIWKHETNEEHVTPKPSSHYKEKGEKFVNPLFYGIDFDGQTILIIGCGPRKRYYKDAIEECHGKLLFCSGNEQLDRINSSCSKASAVLLLKDFLSHAVVWKAVEYCKENNIPFKVVDGLGIKTIVFDARKLLSRHMIEEQEKSLSS